MALRWLNKELKSIGKKYWSHRDDALRQLQKIKWLYPHNKIVAELRSIAEDAPHVMLIMAVELGERHLADCAAQIILCDSTGGYVEQTIDLACQWCSDETVVKIWQGRNLV